MALFRGTNEVVVGDVQGFRQIAEGFRHLIGEGLGTDALFRGGFGDLLAVLVRTSEKLHPVAVQPL